MPSFYIANNSADDSALTLSIHPFTGGTDTIALDAGKAYKIANFDDSVHVTISMAQPDPTVNIVSLGIDDTPNPVLDPDA